MTEVPEAVAAYRRVADRVLDALLELSPEDSTMLGDHRFDDRLSDFSPTGVRDRVGILDEALSSLDQLDGSALPVDDMVDLEIVRTAVAREHWTFSELRPHEHDPLIHLPGEALYALLSREVGEPDGRVRGLITRMVAVPQHLATAKQVLRDMSKVHVETAIGQTGGVIALLGDDVDALVALGSGSGSVAREALAAREQAVAALEDFGRWLEAGLPDADGDPRLGERAFSARLWFAMDTPTNADKLLNRAESDLQAVEEEIAELASRIARRPPGPGLVRDVLDQLAALAPVTNETILPWCERALAHLTARVRELDLVTIPDDPVQIIAMPEAMRGVAVAYCDPPGPLEPARPDGAALPTFFAVSPTPQDWPVERVSSFYLEYNGHMIRNLAAHEGIPGHVLQLAHAARSPVSRLRSAFGSGPFMEGWAQYAEQIVAANGLGLGDDADDGLRMQRLKMQLRSTINAILDVRVHARGMTEDEAMRLMMDRGHQEEGEAAGKWRRALLTSAQLSTYYVGYHSICEVVAMVRDDRPAARDRDVHDAVLAHGSPPPRFLPTLMGLSQPLA